MLIFVDSMSHYTNAFLGEKWDVVNNFGVVGDINLAQSISGVGRNGGGGIVYTGTVVESTPTQKGQYVQKNYDGVSTIICGLALQQSATQCTPGARLLTFMDGNTCQVGILVLQSGQLRAVRSTNIGGGYDGFGGGGVPRAELTTLGQSTSAISSNSFDFLEFKIVHHPTTGSITVRRNGSAFWTLSNVNTAFSGNNQSSSVFAGGYNVSIGGETVYHFLQGTITDFHLLNTTVNGSDPNDPIDFIGDRHWEVVLPSADSTPLEWTINGSANHWENVDAINPPSTATDNNTAVVGNKDALLYQALSGPDTASVLLSYTMYLTKDTGGAVGVSGLMVSPAGGGGTQGNGTEFQVPNPVAFKQSFLCTDPAAPGTDPLTVAIVNAGGHGYERTS